MMKRIFTFLFTAAMLLAAVNVFAQTSGITGKVTDGNEAIVGANVIAVHTESGQQYGTITDSDGNFAIANMKSGAYKLTISFIGYSAAEQEITLSSGSMNLETIELKGDEIGIAEVSVFASIAKDRQTPVAVSSLKADLIEQRVGNQEFPEIMKTTPSVYATKQGGGFGDARINVRGFDQRNVAVMINGIPVNDMENGWVYWSNWAGLSEVANSIQVQRGLGASKLAVPSVGGSINIITNAAKMKKGGSGTVSIGNDGYQKYGLALSSGLMKNGWAFTALGTFSQGNGYVDGTKFKAWSYFLGISKVFNSSHTISLTGVGAPQWHHQRTIGDFDATSLQDYETYGNKYNYQWGMLNGEEFSWRKNFYHKPKIFLNHYWTISDKTDLKTSAYVSLGRGGGTGPRGRINGPNGRIYDGNRYLRDANGQIRFDDIVTYNSGGTVPAQGDNDWGVKDPDADGPFAGQYTTTSSGQGFIRRASMNEHNWYGILSTLTHKLSENLTLTTGVDGRYYKGIHYRKLDDLLGNDAYHSRSDANNPDNYISDPDKKYTDDNILNYHNDGLVSWVGLFGQLEYTNEKISAFLSASASNQGFKRIDYFNYLDSDPEQESDWQNFMGGNVKAGLNYNLNKNHNVFVNAGYISRQPIFDNVFINYVNDINEDAKNQTITAAEFGYGFRSSSVRANLNLYLTSWTNRQFDRSVDEMVGADEVEVQYNFENVGQLHKGLEVDIEWTPAQILTLRGMMSIGDWKYTDNFEGTRTDIDNNVPLGATTLYMKDSPVGDAAHRTFSLGFDLKPTKGLTVYSTYMYYDRLFADFDLADDQFYAANPNILQLDAYGLLDAGVVYRHEMKGFNLVVKGNVNNLLDTEYISELDTNNAEDFMSNKGYYGFGLTWNLGLKVEF